jgi:formylglycine-generating enzyme required for sulfatase activity
MRAVHRGFASAVAIVALAFAPEGMNARAAEKEMAHQEGVQARGGLMRLELGGGVTMELVLIRPGSFIMGDDQGGDDERPAHKVTITKPFYLGKYEVTQRQWKSLMGNNPSAFPGPKNPLENVSPADCQTFIKKLNEKFGDRGAKFSLPTEAQWEYACRAGSTGKYCFGNDERRLGEYAWFAGNSQGETHPVGEKKPNAWGLYDMHGNVAEWCDEHYDKDDYKAAAAKDPHRVVGYFLSSRGGHWYDRASECRSAYRDFQEPGHHFELIGFRVACGQ